MALTDEDRAEIAGLIDAGCGELMNKSLAGITDSLKTVTDACAAMQSRMDAGDQARRDAGDIDERIDTLAKRTAADRARSTADAQDFLAADGLNLTDVQVRADVVATGLGEKCPPPLSGESVTSYRRRLAKVFKRHSKEFASADLDAIKTTDVFKGIEDRIYADATEVGARPPIVGPGRMLCRERTEGGHTIRTWYGSPSCWMDQFMGETGLKATGRFLHDNLGNRAN